MKIYIKHSARILSAYTVSAVVFTFFVIAPLSTANISLWLLIYSFSMFMFMAYTVSRTALAVGRYERYSDEIKSHPAKGFLYGLTAMIPYILFGFIHLVVFDSAAFSIPMRLFHYAFRCALGPMYFIVRTLNYTWYAFIAAYLTPVAISGAWYLAGLKGLDKLRLQRSLRDEEDFLQ